jgi:hypothetical protein
MMRLRAMMAAGAVVTLFLSSALTAQHSLAEDYDTTNPLRLKGILIGIANLPAPNPTYLLVAVSYASGQGEQWAVEGNATATLRQAGWSSETLKGGEFISVVVYRARRGARVAETVPPPRPGRALERVLELAKAGRLAHGTEITLPDGRKLIFGASR